MLTYLDTTTNKTDGQGYDSTELLQRFLPNVATTNISDSSANGLTVNFEVVEVLPIGQD